MSDKKDAIAVFVPGLDSTPGWTALKQEDREWLLEHTSKARQFHGMGVVANIGECRELIAIEQRLAGSPMSMAHYLGTVYRSSARAAYTKMKKFRLLEKNWGGHVIDALVSHGEDIMRGMGGVQLQTFVTVSQEVKPPKVRDPKTIEAWFNNDVRPAISEIKRLPRKGKEIKLDENDAAKMAFNAILRYIRKSQFKTSAEARRWLRLIVGWTMEAQAIHGVLKVGRVSIPEGTIMKVGRPRTPPPKTPKAA